jgi:hemerythrin-like domain-containing protein
MNIYDVLRKDHRAVADIFERIEKTTERAEKGRKDLFATLRAQLSAHARAEEEVFYTPLLERMKDRSMLLEAFEEHGVLALMCDDIADCPVDDERWLAKVTVLREIVDHHVEEEEDEVFGVARKHFSKEEAEAIAARMTARKAELVG